VSHIVHKKKLLIRLVSGAVVATVATGSALLVSGVANATIPPGTLGFLTTSPASGDDIALMSSMTSGPCPVDPNDTRADQTIVGPVQADGTAPDATATFPDSNPFPITRINGAQFSTSQPFVQQFNNTLRDAALVRGKTIQVGEYHLTTHCLDKLGLTVFGTFTGGLNFDTPTHYTVINTAPTPSPTPVVTPSPTPAPGATTTHTTLSVIQIPLPFGLGAFVIPIANVGPGSPAGTVQFKDGDTKLGGPVPVFGGVAVGPFVILPAGQHSVTAVFTPTNPAKFKPSTSNTVKFTFGGDHGGDNNDSGNNVGGNK
jgi:hypothetical protein